ncbi:ATP-binding cassette domain-containing protein [Streptomyces sp. NPDC008092]|uniref:ABC transporter ATP-binding protein n=1 Tax=Streptomyces sp. NPDC008092 TaxID=3364808 RepID=UPI0036E1D1AB
MTGADSAADTAGAATAEAVPALLRVQGLSAGHGASTVVRDIDLYVEPGEVVGLFGPNGAGKTTTLLTLAGCLPAHAGQIEVLGGPVTARTGARTLARRGLRLVPEDRGLFRQLTVRENLTLCLEQRRGGRALIEEALTVLPQLGPLQSRRAGLLSGGEQQQLALARALLGRPRLLLVDEMSLGLAPRIAGELLRTLRTLAVERELGVLLVEQHVPAALEVVDRVYALAHGRLVHSGTADDLRRDPGVLQAAYLGAD